MEKRRAMLIVGPGGSGKTRRAVAEAKVRGGGFLYTSWNDIKHPFGLARVLKCSPKTVIVEGLSLPKREAQAAYLKKLLTEEVLHVREKYSSEVLAVEAPFFIFTMLTPPKPKFIESLEVRFEVLML